MHPIQQKIVQLSKVRDLSSLSLREIGRQISDDPSTRVHPQNIKYHLEQLKNSGADFEMPKINNIVSVPKSVSKLVKIPIVGNASCGPATEIVDNEIKGYLQVSPKLLKTKNYTNLSAWKAVGSSMNQASVMGKNISDGDYVIVDNSKRTPRDGECVVVTNQDDLSNIKRIYFDHEEQMIILRSESTEDYNPIYMSPQDNWDGLVSGTVIQVVKTPAFDWLS